MLKFEAVHDVPTKYWRSGNSVDQMSHSMATDLGLHGLVCTVSPCILHKSVKNDINN